MMLTSRIGWLLPVTVLFVCTNTQIAKAENINNYQFNIDYITSVNFNPNYRPDLGIIRATITGKSNAPAPYGLDFFTSNTYGKLNPSDNPSIQRYNFNADPSVFGLPEEKVLFDIYYGGNNKLFGRASDSAEINFAEGTVKGGGTITIYDGTGLFKNSKGTITFTEEDKLDPSGQSTGLAKLNFNIQTPQEVPEPTTNATLIGIAAMATGLKLRKYYTEKLKVSKSAAIHLVN